MTSNRNFGSVFKEPINKCYSVLRQPIHSDCRIVMNDMVVIHKVSCSNSNDSDEFSWIWKVPDSVNKNIPFFFKILFNFKKVKCFWLSLY
jgi:hypothetical protein